MSLTPEQITAKNFQNFYNEIKPYLNGNPASGYTPVGTVISITGVDAPKYYLPCDGSVYSISSYSELADYFEEQFGESNHFGGDGTSTFAVPNLIGDEVNSIFYCIASRNIFIDLDSDRPVRAIEDRWLRFDPANHKGVIIKAGTSLLTSAKTFVTFKKDTKVDLSSSIGSGDNGKDFYIYLNDDGTITADTSELSTAVKIGRFHTLCADAGANLTMIAPASPSSGLSAGDLYLVKPYRQDEDPDFYSFYNKTITAVSAGTPYDVVTCEHPLKGFVAGDILPESIFCRTFKPDCLYDDAMVYDKGTDICVDVYLQSGTGLNTRSSYNATHTVSRQQINLVSDMNLVGKRLLSDDEFTSIALGSNEKTNITGSSDKTTVGGHVDTNNRRMISAIGVEEACGYLSLVLPGAFGASTSGSWATKDGRGSFGDAYGTAFCVLAAGGYDSGEHTGSRMRNYSAYHDIVNPKVGGRGCTSILRSSNSSANKVLASGSSGGSGSEIFYDASGTERVVGWYSANGTTKKPLYQKTVSFTAISGKWALAYSFNLSSDPDFMTITNSYFVYDSVTENPVNTFVVPMYADANAVVVLGLTYGSGGKIKSIMGSSYIGKTVVVTVQYTKSGDSATPI